MLGDGGRRYRLFLGVLGMAGAGKQCDRGDGDWKESERQGLHGGGWEKLVLSCKASLNDGTGWAR
jgi:hypothetical protein